MLVCEVWTAAKSSLRTGDAPLIRRAAIAACSAACLLRSHRLIRCKNKSQFKAPKTPPSHGLTGFAAIKSGAKSADIQRVNSSQTGLRRLGGMRQPICDQTMNGQSAAQATPDSLQKQEQIKGPENASIARFDGLGCYQTRSGKMSCNLPSAGSLSAAAPDARACWRNWA